MTIPVAGPSITQKEIDYVSRAVASAWYDNANTFHEQFETLFARHCKRRHAISLPSCTAALHLALLALGVGVGDEVIVPDVTWIASAAPICYVGATPVFADIDPQTWCISPDAFEELITPRTKAAIVVDLYGSMPNWGKLLDIASRRGVALIEDSAEAVGSRWHNRPAGSFGLMSAFSFHGSKTLTTGEGGMLVLDDDMLFSRILQLRDHGRAPGDTMFFNAEVGWKYKMSSMQAALGLAQLERIDELVGKKREIFSLYRAELDGWNFGHLNHDIAGLFNSYWMSTLVLEPAASFEKGPLIVQLKERMIDARPFFHPLSSLPAFRNQAEAIRASQRNIVSYNVSPYGINLPSALNLDHSAIRKVCDALRSIVTSSRQ